MNARQIIEGETPKAAFKRFGKYRVNFIKRSARPWEQAIYNVDAVGEEDAIEKGWARLREEVPKRWRLFRLYSCDLVSGEREKIPFSDPGEH